MQVGNGRDALQQSVVLAALLLQVLSHKSCGSERAKNDQSLACELHAPTQTSPPCWGWMVQKLEGSSSAAFQTRVPP